MARGPIPDSYCLIDGVLLAGEYPAAAQHRPARDRLARFLDAGIRTFIDLTEAAKGRQGTTICCGHWPASAASR